MREVTMDTPRYVAVSIVSSRGVPATETAHEDWFVLVAYSKQKAIAFIAIMAHKHQQ